MTENYAFTRVKRSNRGTSLLEIPVGLWIVFMVLFMPLMSLASITLRSTLLNVVVQDAVQAASKAKTFELSNEDGKSAKDTAKDVLNERIASFPGLAALGDIDMDILQSKIVNQQLTRFPEKLNTPADTSQFVYIVEGTAKANVDPTFKFDESVFGAVPGLTVPIQVSFKARQIFENPQGLNK